MRKIALCSGLLVLSLCFAGCATRSISNSGYPGSHRAANPDYRGELSELDVLGLSESQNITDSDIRKALEDKHAIRLQKGGSIIVIQSGALSPDEAMLNELTKNFRAVPFSGIPGKDGEPYSRKLRFVAARGGYSHVLCYWGILETAQQDKVTKAVSWVPIVGGIVPDEAQRMRIRLKAALIDVATGKWSMITPDPIDDSALSSQLTRAQVDQKQVELLKAKSYAVLASELSRYFTL